MVLFEKYKIKTTTQNLTTKGILYWKNNPIFSFRIHDAISYRLLVSEDDFKKHWDKIITIYKKLGYKHPIACPIAMIIQDLLYVRKTLRKIKKTFRKITKKDKLKPVFLYPDFVSNYDNEQLFLKLTRDENDIKNIDVNFIDKLVCKAS